MKVKIDDESTLHYYYLMIDAIARISLLQKPEIEKVRARLLYEATRGGEDQLALQLAAKICEVYLNDQ